MTFPTSHIPPDHTGQAQPHPSHPDKPVGEWSEWQGEFTDEDRNNAAREINRAMLKSASIFPYWIRAMRILKFVPVPGLRTFAVSEKGVVVYEPARVLDYAPGETWTLTEIAMVIVHEFHHVLAKHGARARAQGVDRTTARLWNVAADYEINCVIRKASEALPGGCIYPEDVDLPPYKLAEWYFDQLLEKQQAEDQAKRENPDPESDPQDNDQGDPQDAQGEDVGEGGSAEGEGEGEAQEGEGATGDAGDAGEGKGAGSKAGEGEGTDEGEGAPTGTQPGDFSDSGEGSGAGDGAESSNKTSAAPGTPGASCGSGCDGIPMSPEVEQAIQDALGDLEDNSIETEKAKRQLDEDLKKHDQDIKEEIDKARKVKDWNRIEAAQEGRAPGNYDRWLDHQQASKGAEAAPIPWHVHLRQVIRNAAPVLKRGTQDYTQARRSRRQSAVGDGPGSPQLPAGINATPRVVLAIDTSGSVSDDMIHGMLTEMKKLTRALGLERVRIIACDTKVRGDVTVGNPMRAKGDVIGGGGTRFDPVFERVEESGPKPDVLIYFTDGCGTVRETHKPGYPVVWALWGRYSREPSFSVTKPWGKMVNVDMLCHL